MLAKPPDDEHDFATLQRELLAFIVAHGVAGVMPSQDLLRRAGRADLERAIQAHGGMAAVAARLGLAQRGPRKPYHYWRDPANVDREVLAFIAEHGEPGVMPKKREMEQAGRSDLSVAIARGAGQRVVAARLGLRPADRRSAPDWWADFAHVEQALAAFLAEPDRPQRMPTLRELLRAGRFDLHYAVQRYGVYATAERMGLATATKQRAGPGAGGGMAGNSS